MLEDLHSNPTNSDDCKFIILKVSALKNNDQIGRATIAVSNRIREYIDSCNDRLYLGNGTCKAHDSFHVKRCYKCQQYGHISENCKHSSACGYCGGSHETRNCNTKNNPSAASCVNCKNSNVKTYSDNCQHSSSSIECPILKVEQTKLKKSIPFYRRKLLVTQKITH